MAAPGDPLPAVTALAPEEIAESLGAPPFRGRQIRRWVWKGGTGLASMTDLPAAPRAELLVRLLVRQEDGALVECVLMPDGRRLTLDLSSRLGRPVGCAFWA